MQNKDDKLTYTNCKKCIEHKIKGKRCKICVKEINRRYYLKNKDKCKKQATEWKKNNRDKTRAAYKKYRENNVEKEKLRHKKYYKNNIEKINKYYLENKCRINEYKNKWVKAKYKNEISFKLRVLISRNVRLSLNGKKGNKSILSYLPYAIDDLKKHLESQFEPWMTWDNWGLYNSNTWNDNDSSTWTWQLDHIIPQSDLLYDSMEHSNFQMCWALENLRPFSSTNNIIDGARRNRHRKLK